jgi:hypothetical protein
MAFELLQNFAPLEKFINEYELSTFAWLETPGEDHAFGLAYDDYFIAHADFVKFNKSIRVVPSKAFHKLITGEEPSWKSTLNIQEIFVKAHEDLRNTWDCEDLLEDYLLMAMILELPWSEVAKCSPLLLQAEISFGLTKETKDKERILKILHGTADLEIAKIWVESAPTSWAGKMIGRSN